MNVTRLRKLILISVIIQIVSIYGQSIFLRQKGLKLTILGRKGRFMTENIALIDLMT